MPATLKCCSLKFIKALIEELVKHETLALDYVQHEESEIDMIHVGEVNYQYPEEDELVQECLPIYITPTKARQSYASIVRFEGGRYAILLDARHFEYLLEREDLNTVLIGVIAHELGHYLAGHFGLSDEETIESKHLDQNTRKQHYFLTVGSSDAYIRSTVCGILKGGCVKAELEADLIGVKFAGLGPILSSHLYDLDLHENLAVNLEKQNRIKRIIQLVKDEEIAKDARYRLHIVIEGD